MLESEEQQRLEKGHLELMTFSLTRCFFGVDLLIPAFSALNGKIDRDTDNHNGCNDNEDLNDNQRKGRVFEQCVA